MDVAAPLKSETDLATDLQNERICGIECALFERGSNESFVAMFGRCGVYRGGFCSSRCTRGSRRRYRWHSRIRARASRSRARAGAEVASPPRRATRRKRSSSPYERAAYRRRRSEPSRRGVVARPIPQLWFRSRDRQLPRLASADTRSEARSDRTRKEDARFARTTLRS